MGRQRRKGENENIKKKEKENRQRGMKIGVGEGDWKDLSDFEKLGAIYTKEVLWTFYHSAHQQSIKQLLFSFFLTAKLLILSECAEIKVFLSVLMSPIQYYCLHFRQERPGFITAN